MQRTAAAVGCGWPRRQIIVENFVFLDVGRSYRPLKQTFQPDDFAAVAQVTRIASGERYIFINAVMCSQRDDLIGIARIVRIERHDQQNLVWR